MKQKSNQIKICFPSAIVMEYNFSQGSDWTERKSSVQFESSLFWWTLNWTQFKFLLKELELNLVHLLCELERKWTEKFSSFFYHKTKVFWLFFYQKMLLPLQFFFKIKNSKLFEKKIIIFKTLSYKKHFWIVNRARFLAYTFRIIFQVNWKMN